LHVVVNFLRRHVQLKLREGANWILALTSLQTGIRQASMWLTATAIIASTPIIATV